jgi:hypothetical protein
MVLLGKLSGRVGRRRKFLYSPESSFNGSGFLFFPGEGVLFFIKSLTSGDDALNHAFFPTQVDFHVMFFGFYDFFPQIAEIYVKRMANHLFFFFHKFHITYLQAVFNSTALICGANTSQFKAHVSSDKNINKLV